MKRFAILFVGLSVLAASSGCCCMGWGSPCYGGGGYGGACGPGGCGYGSPYAPYGAGVVAPTSAYYYPSTTVTAAAPIYPMTAGAPIEMLPTY